MTDGPRYTFHPLERRGVLLGLDAGQLVAIGAAAVLAFVVHAAAGGSAGMGLGALVLAGGITAAVWTREGSSVAAWAVVKVGWWTRRPSQPRLDDAPTAGRTTSTTESRRSPGHRRPQPKVQVLPVGIEVVDAEPTTAGGPLGVIRDRRGGTWGAVVPVRGSSFSLLDPLDQAQKLEGWRRVLGAVARPDTPVARLQWVQRSWTGPTSDQDAGPPGWSDATSSRPEADARASYQGLIDSTWPDIACHEAWLVLVVGGQSRRGAGPRPSPPLDVLRRELRFLDGQIRAADLEPAPPLDGSQLRRMLGSSRGRPGQWPLASEEAWAVHRTDDEWHATYWVAEWPRVDVRPDFLGPLLLCSARSAVSVVMSPIPTDRAIRAVRSARTADLADEELRARAGFLPSARRDRERDGVTRREEELADGHHDFRFSGYVTVSATNPEALVGACAEIEHAAQASRLELRRLFGRQAEAYTWTLPLGRGLR